MLPLSGKELSKMAVEFSSSLLFYRFTIHRMELRRQILDCIDYLEIKEQLPYGKEELRYCGNNENLQNITTSSLSNQVMMTYVVGSLAADMPKTIGFDVSYNAKGK